MPGLTKAELLSAVRQGSAGELVKLTAQPAQQGSVWFAFQGNTGEGSSLLIAKAEEAQWSFKEQLGAGYIFVPDGDSGQQVVATSQQWTRKYVLYKVPAALAEIID